MRVKVACINWSHPDAPHAMSYVYDDPELGAQYTAYHATWCEAMERAEVLVRVTTRALKRRQEAADA